MTTSHSEITPLDDTARGPFQAQVRYLTSQAAAQRWVVRQHGMDYERVVREARALERGSPLVYELRVVDAEGRVVHAE